MRCAEPCPTHQLRPYSENANDKATDVDFSKERWGAMVVLLDNKYFLSLKELHTFNIVGLGMVANVHSWFIGQYVVELGFECSI